MDLPQGISGEDSSSCGGPGIPDFLEDQRLEPVDLPSDTKAPIWRRVGPVVSSPGTR
jgi:hypothetical protein